MYTVLYTESDITEAADNEHKLKLWPLLTVFKQDHV